MLSHCNVPSFQVKHSPNNFHAAVHGADGFVLVYSILDRRSLLVVEQTISYLHHVRKVRDLPIVLVGEYMTSIYPLLTGVVMNVVSHLSFHYH